MAKLSTPLLIAKGKKIALASGPAAKVRGIGGKIEQLNTDAQDLRAAADGIRKTYPPEIAEHFDNILRILRKADGYAQALGTDYGEVDRVAEWPSPDLTQQLHRAGRFIWDKDDAIPDWIFRGIREQVQETLHAWRDFSNGAFLALSIADSVVSGATRVYDAATWTVDSTVDLLSQSPRDAAAAICRDFIGHSGYRRYKLSRVPGKHAAWNEVCDFWAENDTAPFGESFKWPRPEDPMYRGLPPTAMRTGKSIVEEGCLPDENCYNDPYGYQYHIDRYGLRATINPVLGFPTSIQRIVTGREVDDLFDLSNRLLNEAIELLNLLQRRINAIHSELDKTVVKIALLALPVVLSRLEVGFDIATSTVFDCDRYGCGNGAFTRTAYHVARAKSEMWNPEEAYDQAVRGLSNAAGKLEEVEDMLNIQWEESPIYRGYWRGTPFADDWRERIDPYIEKATRSADDIKILINGAAWSNACNSLYPKASGTRAALGRYWEAQGVPSRCYAPVGSYVPTVTPRFDPPTRRQGGQFTTGGSESLTTSSFGAVAPATSGLKSWQKIAMVGGLLWLMSRGK